MKINIEYDPNGPEDLILADGIIKCNAMASVLWNLYNCDKKDFSKDLLFELLDGNSINIEKLWS